MHSTKFNIISLYVMMILYVFAGINHFLHSGSYVSIMPHFLPYKLALVYISGVFEILLGLLLIPVKTRRIAAIGIIVLLIAVFPANIQMSVDYYASKNPYFWISLVRLPLQFVLIWWAYGFATKRKSEFE